jgi:hypothetical protein
MITKPSSRQTTCGDRELAVRSRSGESRAALDKLAAAGVRLLIDAANPK